jgi:predicted ATPase
VHAETYVFGSFQFNPEGRLLLDRGRPTKLGSRALDILIALVEAAGETVSKAEIRSRAWPTTAVDEVSLRVHISALRRALGDGKDGSRFIVNVPGRGYQFVAPITREQCHSAAAIQDAPFNHERPLSLPSIIGRTKEIASLTDHLSRRRLVSVVGPGGVGKTTVAIATATAAKGSFRDGVWFVALDSIDRPESIASAVGAALGVTEDGIGPMLARLRDKQALIVFDNCEHIIDAAAATAEAILRASPGTSILATSRESLRAQGEFTFRLKPLETPPVHVAVTADEALTYAAVQLFAERAQAYWGDFVVNDTNASAICEICHGLDGLPLALELAAAQTEVVGIHGLAQTLHNRFALLTRGRRTALQRQRSLRSMMDWSYSLLSESEKITLHRVAVFPGHFTMKAATEVASDEQFSSIDMIKGLVNLVTKSLITTDTLDGVAYLRLLETTRVYALEKFANSRESERLRQRHAEYDDPSFRSADACQRRVPRPGRKPLEHRVQESSGWWPASNAAGETPTWKHSIAQYAKSAPFEQSSLMANV